MRGSYIRLMMWIGFSDDWVTTVLFGSGIIAFGAGVDIILRMTHYIHNYRRKEAVNRSNGQRDE